MANARFLLRPRWLLSHALVLALVVLMVNLGFWQLRRLEEKRDRNELIESRGQEPVVPVGAVLDAGDDARAVGDVRYRRVTATGTYDADGTVAIRNRTKDGVAGAWLATPLDLGEGERVAIIRGFVRLDSDGQPFDAPAPSGEVTVEGSVVAPERLDGTAPRDIEPLIEADGMLPAAILATDSDPGEPAAESEGVQPAVLVPVPPPELSEGPHLSYAVQWFIFSTIAIAGYPLVLRRVIRRRGLEAGDADDLDRELEQLLRRG